MKRFADWLTRDRAGILTGICAGLLIGGAILAAIHRQPPPHAEVPAFATRITPPPRAAHYAEFGAEQPSSEVRYLTNWIADSGDAGNAGFVVLDKKQATLYIFDGEARLAGASPVLLGAARGDDTVPGIGAKPLSQVRPEERTTPAGRFVGERGHNARGEDVVWVDYDAAVSMHRVLTTNPVEKRLERLATPTVDDNRISYGCVNVPKAFYESRLRPVFANQRAIIYVLPDVKPLTEVFAAYDVAAKHGARAAAAPTAARVN